MLRSYEEKDILRMIEIEEKVLHSSLGYEYYQNDLNNPLARHYVWEEDKQVIGFISSVYDGFSLEILNFGVDEPYQHQGFGTKILSSVLDELIISGLNHAILEVRASNQVAIQLYQKLGFKEIHRRIGYYNNGEDALVLQKLYSSKKDIANIEAILFSKKKGYKYESDFKERYCLNYYDLYDEDISDLNFIKEASFIQINTNKPKQSLFPDYEESKTYLMHVGLYRYQSLNKDKFLVQPITSWSEFLKMNKEENACYGEEYASSLGQFLKKHQNHHMLLVGAYDQNHLVGYARMLFYEHSIFIDSVYTLEAERHRGVCSSIFDFIIEYAKFNHYDDLYLEAEEDDTVYLMYQKMNFKIIETLYEYLKVN